MVNETKPLIMFLANSACERKPHPGDPGFSPGLDFQVTHWASVGLSESPEQYQADCMSRLLEARPPQAGWTRHKVEVKPVERSIIEQAAADLKRLPR